MPWTSTADRYGTVAIAIHWITALAVIGLLISGFQAAGMANAPGQAGLLRIHAVLGISVLVLTILRLAWWWLIDRKPLPPADMPRWQSRAATSVHGLFYVVILVMAASGIGMLVVSQAAQVLFFGAPRPLPDFDAYAPRIPHGIGGRLMVALICLHVAAALYHQFIRRDRLLRRMGLGR